MTNEAKEWPRLVIGQEPIMTSRSREPLYIGKNHKDALFLGTKQVLNAANVHPSVESRDLVRLRGEITIGKRTIFDGSAHLAGVTIGDDCEFAEGACVANSTLRDKVYIGNRAFVSTAFLQEFSNVGCSTSLNMFNTLGRVEPSAPNVADRIRLTGIQDFVSDNLLVHDKAVYYFIAGEYLRVGCTTKKIVDWINPELLCLSESYRIIAAANWQALLEYYAMRAHKSERSSEIQTLRAMAKLLFDQPAFKFQRATLESAKFRLPAG